MRQSDIFSPKRFGFLVRRDILINWKQVLVSASAIAGVGLLLSLLSCFFGNPSENYFAEFFGLFLMLGGAIVSSMMFRDMHSRNKNHDWLMMPSSTFEKFLSRWVISSVGFVLASLVLFWIVSVLSMGLNELVLDKHNGMFNPFAKDLWVLIGHYMIIQSIYLLGGAYFKKMHFVKTVLALIVLSLGISLVSIFAFRIVFSDYFSSGMFTDGFSWNIDIDGPFFDSDFDFMATLGKVVYFGLVAPLCWVVTYLRLKEVEVKDGV